MTNPKKALPPLDSELHAVLRAIIEVFTATKIADYLRDPTPAKRFKARQLGDIAQWARGLV